MSRCSDKTSRSWAGTIGGGSQVISVTVNWHQSKTLKQWLPRKSIASGCRYRNGPYPKSGGSSPLIHLQIDQKLFQDRIARWDQVSPDDQIQAAIKLGVAKVNVNTECQIAFANATVNSYVNTMQTWSKNHLLYEANFDHGLWNQVSKQLLQLLKNVSMYLVQKQSLI